MGAYFPRGGRGSGFRIKVILYACTIYLIGGGLQGKFSATPREFWPDRKDKGFEI
jgi:hypothetical protein